jgi:hypothetical protein
MVGVINSWNLFGGQHEWLLGAFIDTLISATRQSCSNTTRPPTMVVTTSIVDDFGDALVDGGWSLVARAHRRARRNENR